MRLPWWSVKVRVFYVWEPWFAWRPVIAWTDRTHVRRTLVWLRPIWRWRYKTDAGLSCAYSYRLVGNAE